MKKLPSAAGAGCLTLFALPFAAVGVGAFYWAASTLTAHNAIQAWVETPAVIKHAELKRNRGDDGDTFEAIAVYEYDFGGRHFTGNRVSVYSGSDNIGSFQQQAHRELQQYLDQGRPFRCFVDPADPAEAVLYRELRWEMLAFYTMFAALFGCAGFGMMAAAIGALRESERLAAAGDPPPDQPWLVRSDWADGRVEESTSAALSVPTLSILALWWNVASLPLAIKLPEIITEADSGWAWLTLLSPAIGVGLILAVLNRVAARKFGQSVFEMASVPGVVGGQLAGIVRFPQAVRPLDGFHLKLSCTTKVKDSDGDGTTKTLWQDERQVREQFGESISDESVVPVLFAIPFDAAETTTTATDPPIEWQLEMWARLPGVDYSSRFIVPIFRTVASRPDFEIDESLTADFAPPPNPDQLLAEAGIVKLPLAGRGVRLEFPAARHRKQALVVSAITAGWTGLVWFLTQADVPNVFPIVFGLFDLPLVHATLDLWFHRSIIEATPTGLTTRSGLFTLGRTRTLAADQIRRFGTAEYMESGTHVWKTITVVPHEGKPRTIAKGLGSRLVERAVLEELNKALGHDRD